MGLFGRIFRVAPSDVEQAEQRLAKRYVIPADSPLRAEIVVGLSAFPVEIMNISTSGIRVVLVGDRPIAPGARCTVRLLVEDMVFKQISIVANVNLTGGNTQVGLKYDENKFEDRESLIQLLEPIEVGNSLKEVDAANLTQTEPGLVARRFFSAGSTYLTLWRNIEDDALQGFEFRIHDFFVRNGATPPQLRIYRDDGTQAFGYSAPTLQQSNAESREMTRYFNWVVAHIHPDFPADIREFLGQYVTPLAPAEKG